MASIRKIEGKGGVSYKITVTMGTDYAGKQAEKEAKRIAFDFEREIELGYQADNRQTFAAYE